MRNHNHERQPTLDELQKMIDEEKLLKPCPFCKTAKWFTIETISRQYYAECTGCRMRTRLFDIRADMIKFLDTRPNEERLQVRLEKLWPIQECVTKCKFFDNCSTCHLFSGLDEQ